MDLKPYLDNIRSRMQLSAFIGRYIKLSKKGREFTGCCPFHHEKTPSFTVNDQKGFYHCFGCGAHGDLITFSIEYQKMQFMDAVKMLAGECGVALPERQNIQQSKEQQEQRNIQYKIVEDTTHFYQKALESSLGQRARDYIHSRKFSKNAVDHFRLGYAPSSQETNTNLTKYLTDKGYQTKDLLESGLILKSDRDGKLYDRFRGRLMFPIFDDRGQPIAFGGRILGKGEPKYLNSSDTPIFHKGRTLYSYHNAFKNVKENYPFIVVEGYFDVIALYEAGYPQAVAPLGTALTEDQILKLWRSQTNPTLCFDGDNAGRRAAKRAAMRSLPLLKAGKSLQFTFLPQGEDPDSLIKGGRNIGDFLNQTTPLSQILWDTLVEEINPQTPEGFAKLENRIKEVVDEIKAIDVQSYYKRDLFSRLRLFTYQHSNPKKSFQKPFPKRPVFKAPTLGDKKNDKMVKILLVTVINHPTLIARVDEQLMSLSIQDDVLSSVRDEILSCTLEDIKGHIQSFLGENSPLWEEFLNLSTLVPFADSKTDATMAFDGWMDVYERFDMATKKEQDSLTSKLKDDFDPRAWKELKLLKKDLFK